jgi:tetraacyldisaccharide 4'-kinase
VKKFKAFCNALERLNPEIILIDDGYQHRWIERDLNILIFDENTLRNPNFPPKGRLRESINSINRADIILIPLVLKLEHNMEISEPQNIIYYQIKLGEIYSPDSIMKFDYQSKFVPVSGIANPDRFINSLKSLDLNILREFKYSDHHNYTLKDVEKIIITAKKNSASVISTEKDFVKLVKFLDNFNDEKISIFVLPIEFEILDTENILRNKIIEIYKTKIKGEN